MESAVQRPRLFLSRFRSSKPFILTAICLAAFTDGFLYAVVIPVLPYSLGHESGIPEKDIQKWSSYLLIVFGSATLITSPFAGWLADRTTSRRLPFLIGLVLQAMSTLLFLFSPKVEILLIARALQGVSAAVVYSVGLAIIVDTVGMADTGKNAGYFISSANMGVLISPLIGGFVYDKAGYRAVIIMMLALVVVDIVLRLFMVEKPAAVLSTEDDEEESDVRQPIIANQAAAAIVYGSMGGRILDQRKKRRSLPAFILLLSSPRALADVYAVLVSYILLAAFDAGLAVFLKERFQWSSSSVGATFLAIALPSLLSPVAGSLSGRYGPKRIATLGFTLSAGALFAIGFIQMPTFWQITSLYTLLGLIGTGIAFVLPCVADDLTAIANELTTASYGGGNGRGAYAQAYALFGCGMAGGTVLGPLWMSSASHLGWQTVNIALGLLALSACGPILIFYKIAKLEDTDRANEEGTM